MSLLTLHNVKVSYGAVEALRGISLTVETGQIVSLIGCNGAGKSTTLRAISGLLPLSQGEIYFEGKPIHRLPPHTIVALGIAHAPEGRGIFQNLSVLENLQMGAFLRKDKTHIREDLEKVFERFPRLRERRTQPAGTLSGGEQQMLAIGRALLLKPKLLLLDEPSLGLAPQVVKTIFSIIRDINTTEKTTILLVEQNAHLALETAHFGYVLEVGEISLKDTSAQLKQSDRVKKAYLGG